MWGDNLWCLAALYLNEKTDLANERLLERAREYIATKPANAPATTPEQPGNLPWTFFSVTDYVRTLCLFHAKTPHFPGRLKPETEAAMKETLWLWVSGESRLADVGANDMFLLLGTENHDLNRRPAYYLVTALLQDDPSYRDRRRADGHTTAEHAAAYTAFYREWPRSRARTGVWVEVGSNTYQKYSWPTLFNLRALAPDPVIRRRFGLLLDLAFIEEEQLSVRSRRGGGRSRAYPGVNGFESYKSGKGVRTRFQKTVLTPLLFRSHALLCQSPRPILVAAHQRQAGGPATGEDLPKPLSQWELRERQDFGARRPHPAGFGLQFSQPQRNQEKQTE